MSSNRGKVLIIALCAIPALGFDARTRDGSVVASFYPACPEYRIPPRVRTRSLTSERFPPSTELEILEFEKGKPPARTFKVLGEVEVLARGHKTTLTDLHEKAKDAAARMGGDALVDVAWRDAGRTEPRIGERGLYVLTAKVARLNARTSDAILVK